MGSSKFGAEWRDSTRLGVICKELATPCTNWPDIARAAKISDGATGYWGISGPARRDLTARGAICRDWVDSAQISVADAFLLAPTIIKGFWQYIAMFRKI